VTLPDESDGQRFNLSQLAISAALAGQGVAMGRSALVLEEIESGRLVDLWGIHAPSEASYHFVCAHGQTEQVAEVEAWLAHEGAAFDTARRRLLTRRG